jgi:hypothetical protein
METNIKQNIELEFIKNPLIIRKKSCIRFKLIDNSQDTFDKVLNQISQLIVVVD